MGRGCTDQMLKKALKESRITGAGGDDVGFFGGGDDDVGGGGGKCVRERVNNRSWW